MADIPLQLPAQDLNSECTILGILSNFSVVFDKGKPETLGCVDRARAILSADDFYDPKNQIIYLAILHILDRHEYIDASVLWKHFDGIGELARVGGPSYISGLEQYVINPNAIEFHAHRVREASIRRTLHKRLVELVDIAEDPKKEIQEISAALAKTCEDLSRATLTSRAYDTEEMCQDAWENIVAGVETPQWGVPTGIRRLDFMTNGWQGGDLIILAARPSVGKTAMALQLTLNALKEGVGVIFFSLEMNKRQLIDRLIAQETQIPLSTVRRRHLNEGHLTQIGEFLDTLKGYSLFVQDSVESDAASILSQTNVLKIQHQEIGLVVLDYLQLVDDKSARGKEENRNLELGRVTRGLKKLAGKFDIPVIALSQLSRGLQVTNREPQLNDLRDSGSIEQDADLVAFLHRPNPPDEITGIDDVDLIIRKQRNGALGKIPLSFVQARTFFATREDEGKEPQENWYNA